MRPELNVLDVLIFLGVIQGVYPSICFLFTVLHFVFCANSGI